MKVKYKECILCSKEIKDNRSQSLCDVCLYKSRLSNIGVRRKTILNFLSKNKQRYFTVKEIEESMPFILYGVKGMVPKLYREGYLDRRIVKSVGLNIIYKYRLKMRR